MENKKVILIGSELHREIYSDSTLDAKIGYSVVATVDTDLSEGCRKQRKYGLSSDACYTDPSAVFEKEKFADIMIFNSVSSESFTPILSAITLGYEVLADNGGISNSENAVISDDYNVIVDQGQSSFLIICRSSSVETYEKYISRLMEDGYSLYAKNNICDNLFATCDNGEYVVNVGYYAYENATRIAISKKTTMLNTEPECVGVGSVVPSLAFLGVAGDRATGMSLCYQLSDGSFMIIDGGWYDDAEYLYNYLKSKAGSSEIVIAAWIITHADGDHCQAFIEFIRRYCDKVRIEKVISNIPKQYLNDNNIIDTFDSLPADKFVKIHTGQKFYVRDALVEMLHTIDDLETANCNAASLVFTVELEGTRVMFTADATEHVAKILLPMYGDYLKSDILQLSHHGLRNGTGLHMDNTAELYRVISADVVLWPNIEYYYTLNDGSAYCVSTFYWNRAAEDISKEMYLAGERGQYRILELPYKADSSYLYEP